MNDLISRQSVIDLLKYWSGGYSYIEKPTDGAIEDIESLPSIDAVQVIRCEKCKYSDPNGVYGCRLKRFSFFPAHMYGDDFCSRGKRRSDE